MKIFITNYDNTLIIFLKHNSTCQLHFTKLPSMNRWSSIVPLNRSWFYCNHMEVGTKTWHFSHLEKEPSSHKRKVTSAAKPHWKSLMERKKKQTLLWIVTAKNRPWWKTSNPYLEQEVNCIRREESYLSMTRTSFKTRTFVGFFGYQLKLHISYIFQAKLSPLDPEDGCA